MLNVIIAGLGGQGTVFASRLIGEAAAAAGCAVRGSETIGMAQRGGAVTSHLRISGGEIFSPLIPPGGADLIIAFEAGEAVRAADFLAPGGVMAVCGRVIMPTGGGETYDAETMFRWLRANIRRLFIADGEELTAQCGGRCLNTAMAGFAMQTGLFPFSAEDMEEIIRKKTKPRFVEQNIEALRAGLRYRAGEGA